MSLMKKKDVLKAAKHIKEEIQDQIYENDTYPASDAFLDDNDYNVPSLLNLMLSKVILPVEKNRHSDKKYKHISAAAHVVMNAARPKSFKSPLLLSIAVTLHRKFGSKSIIDLLHSLGLSASYKEALLYERLAAIEYTLKIKIGPSGILKPFMQFGMDNADFNTNTLTGKDSFHYFGIVGILASKLDLEKRERITRWQDLPLASEVEARGKIHLKVYNYRKELDYKQ